MQATSELRSAAGAAWMVLMLATVISTWGLANHALAPRLGTPAMIVVAAIKVRLVLTYFMELRHAPAPLKLIFDAWIAGLGLALLALYLLPR